jgi:hypothetical protein
MACKIKQSGRETIQMFREIFHIDSVGIRKLTLVAECNSITTLQIDTFLELKDVDITSTEISRDTVVDSHTYEVTIKRINKESK